MRKLLKYFFQDENLKYNYRNLNGKTFQYHVDPKDKMKLLKRFIGTFVQYPLKSLLGPLQHIKVMDSLLKKKAVGGFG